MNESNYKEHHGSKLPPILTDKKFIEFIKKYLTVEGFIPEADLEVRAGNDIRVDGAMDGKTRLAIVHYEPSNGPTHSLAVSPSWLEFGTPAAIGSITITGQVNKGSKDLKEVVWGDVAPALNMDQAALLGLAKVDVNVTNATAMDGLATRVANEGRYADTSGKGGKLNAAISRRKRWFWGVCPTKNPADAAALLSNPSYFKSVVGGKPKELAFDPGYLGLMYRWFIVPEPEAQALEAAGKLQLLDSNSPCHSTDTTKLSISPNPAHAAYAADYRFMYASMAVDVKSVLTTE